MKLKIKVKRKLRKLFGVLIFLLVLSFIVLFILKIINNSNDTSEEDFIERVNDSEASIGEGDFFIHEPGWCGDGICEPEFSFDFDCSEDCANP